MKQTDNRQKELKQLKAQKGHLLPFRDKSHLPQETRNRAGEREEDEVKPKDVERSPIVSPDPKVGRNDPCPCGSGKKYKKCCMDKK